ncbi:MAG: hypothetical protein JWM54_1439 [Acidobacteriaceae bacterium]|jgi:predicted RNA-binding protein YlqC (UPF0109 family)|nr:hypothetical protein [Acidobacteriaceae bacterium]
MTHDEKLDAAEELITQIARALVDHPDEVLVEAVEGEEGEDVSVIEMRVAPNDVGKVIGKQGRTVRSMRTILSALGQVQHLRYELDIIEDDEDEGEDEDAYEDGVTDGSESTTA